VHTPSLYLDAGNKGRTVKGIRGKIDGFTNSKSLAFSDLTLSQMEE
jgi:hypothetical protein